jgi:hypothetical protein
MLARERIGLIRRNTSADRQGVGDPAQVQHFCVASAEI